MFCSFKLDQYCAVQEGELWMYQPLPEVGGIIDISTHHNIDKHYYQMQLLTFVSTILYSTKSLWTPGSTSITIRDL